MTAGRGCLFGLRRHAGGAGRQWTPRAVEQIRNACTRGLEQTRSGDDGILFESNQEKREKVP